MNHPPLLIIDDDEHDCEMFKIACVDMHVKNELVIFHNPALALGYLRKMNTPVSCVLCDVHMPLINGIELLEKIKEDEALREKAFPFMYWSGLDGAYIQKHNPLSGIQGFFKKPDNRQGFKHLILALVSYCELFHASVNLL